MVKINGQEVLKKNDDTQGHKGTIIRRLGSFTTKGEEIGAKTLVARQAPTSAITGGVHPEVTPIEQVRAVHGSSADPEVPDSLSQS